MARFVYADNAATTPVSPTVFAAMKPFYTCLLYTSFCCAAGQGQTTAKPADVNIQELNTKWAKFTQYAEQKQINKAVEELSLIHIRCV